MNGKGLSQTKIPLHRDETEERKRSWWAVLILDRLGAFFFFECGLPLTPE
jgi:hypothetical protein